MGVGDDDDPSRAGEPVIRHELVADAFVDIHKVGDTLFIRELAELFMVVGLFFRGAGSVVIKEKDDLFGIKDFFPAHFVKGFYGLII